MDDDAMVAPRKATPNIKLREINQITTILHEKFIKIKIEPFAFMPKRIPLNIIKNLCRPKPSNMCRSTLINSPG